MLMFCCFFCFVFFLPLVIFILTTHGFPVSLHNDSGTRRSALVVKEVVDAKNLFRAIICQLHSIQGRQYSVESVVWRVVCTQSRTCTRMINTCTSAGRTLTVLHLLPASRPADLCRPCFFFSARHPSFPSPLWGGNDHHVGNVSGWAPRKPLPPCLGNPINLSGEAFDLSNSLTTAGVQTDAIAYTQTVEALHFFLSSTNKQQAHTKWKKKEAR